MSVQGNFKVDTAKELLSDILSKLGFEVNLSVSSSCEERLDVKIDSDEGGMLIGYHGETLNALQTLFTQILFRKTGQWVRVLLNVGDYRQKRQEKIHAIAKRGAEKARFLSTAVALPPMPPAERREVHLVIAEIPGVMSLSTDSGAARRVVIKPEESEGG